MLDTEIDVILDDLPDVAATLHEMRSRKPALWGRGFGEPALLLLSHELVNAAFHDEDVVPVGRVLQPRRDRRARPQPAVHVRRRAPHQPRAGLAGVPPAADAGAGRPAARAGRARADRPVRRQRASRPRRRLHEPLPVHRHHPAARAAAALRGRGQAVGARACSTSRTTTTFAVQCSHEFMEFVQPILEQRRRTTRATTCSRRSPPPRSKASGSPTTRSSTSCACCSPPAPTPPTSVSAARSTRCSRTPTSSRSCSRTRPSDAARAGEEGIRLDPPTAWIPRRNPRDVVWHGIEIPAGAPMFLGVMAANRDPAVYPDPDRFDVTPPARRHGDDVRIRHALLPRRAPRPRRDRRRAAACSSSGCPTSAYARPTACASPARSTTCCAARTAFRSRSARHVRCPRRASPAISERRAHGS